MEVSLDRRDLGTNGGGQCGGEGACGRLDGYGAAGTLSLLYSMRRPTEAALLQARIRWPGPRNGVAITHACNKECARAYSAARCSTPCMQRGGERSRGGAPARRSDRLPGRGRRRRRRGRPRPAAPSRRARPIAAWTDPGAPMGLGPMTVTRGGLPSLDPPY